jgi:AraC-like DNA-binding protein
MPIPTRLTLVAGLVSRLVEVGVRCGLDRDQLLAAARIDPAMLEGRDNRLPVETMARLWRVVARELPGKVLAIEWLATLKPSDLGVLGYVLAQMTDLGEALEVACRYGQLVNQGALLRLERSAPLAQVTFTFAPSLLATQQQPETALTGLTAFIRTVVDPSFIPSAVHLPHPRTERTKTLEEFFGTSVEHGQPRVALRFPVAMLSQRLPGADPNLGAYLRQHAEEMLAHIEVSKSVTHETARRLAERLTTGEPSQALIAKQMGLSERTLQRRLQSEGTTFNQLLEETRRSIAMSYLADRNLAAYEVSFLVGYAEPATFFRAFKRWTGKTPQQYRATAAG